MRADLSRSRDESRPGGWRLAAFASLAVPIYAAQMPLNVYLPAMLTQHYGLPLAMIGLIFLIERLWGALADPLIGIVSDRTDTLYGRRRTWILAGGILFGLGTVGIFFPPLAISVPYLAVVLFVFYTGWAMMQIPHLAWSGEISHDYHERTRIQTHLQVAGAISLLLVLVLPTLLDQWRPNDIGAKQAAFGAFILLSLVVSLPLVLRSFPDQSTPDYHFARPTTLQALQLVVREKLLVRIILSDFAVVFGQLVRSTLFVFFVAIYMGLPHWASGLFLLQYIFGIAAGPIWLAIGRRLGKHRTAITGELVQVAINLGLLLVTPQGFWLLIGLTVAQGLAQGSGNQMLRSMVADIADKHRLETGIDQTALFFSAFSLSMKAAMAAAVGIALPLVGWLGFDPAGPNSADALHGLLFVFALGPALAHAVSAALLLGFPLDEAAHSEIRARLDAGPGVLVPAE